MTYQILALDRDRMRRQINRATDAGYPHYVYGLLPGDTEKLFYDRRSSHECGDPLRRHHRRDLHHRPVRENRACQSVFAERITIICDNPRYYRSKAVAEYVENSRINLLFLPPYSPNLNLIERFWKFFERQVLYNRYYEAFNDYKNACKRFFRELDSYQSQLRSLLTANFDIIEN